MNNECKHELLLQECGLCNGKQKYDLNQVDDQSYEFGWFSAKYDGRCGVCGDLVEVGDALRYINKVIACLDCGSV